MRELVDAGHQVLGADGAGAGIGFEDSHYQAAGADVAANGPGHIRLGRLVVKVKEPQLGECRLLRSGQILFTYLHLAADPEQAQALMASGATAIAYETVTAPDGSLPLLTPMSEVAGRMSVQVGANCLQKANGGFGVLLGGVPGVAPAKVVMLGGGVSGHSCGGDGGRPARRRYRGRPLGQAAAGIVGDFRQSIEDGVFDALTRSRNWCAMPISSSARC